MKYVKVLITSGIRETLENEDAKNILSFLGILIPNLMHTFFNIKYDMNLNDKFFINPYFKDNKEIFFKTLQKLGILNSEISEVKKAIKAKNILDNKEAYFKLKTLFSTQNKERIEKKLKDRDVFNDLNKVFSIFRSVSNTEKEFSKSNWKTLQFIAQSPINNKIKQYLNSIENINPDNIENNYKEAQNKYDNFVKKSFNGNIPNSQELKELKEKDKDLYSQYNKLKNEKDKQTRHFLFETWKNRGLDDISDVRDVKKLLAELKLEDPIDNGFEGKIELVPDKEKISFNYYTKYGVKLNTVPCSKVVMNPDYDEKDTVYYCTFYPKVTTEKSKPSYCYTVPYVNSRAVTNHIKAKFMAQNCEAFYKKVWNDIKPIAEGEEPDANSMTALAIAVILDTAGRVGNKKSEVEHDNFGITTLKHKHLSFNKSRTIAYLNYRGKKSVEQNNKVTDPVIVQALDFIKEADLKSEKPLFSYENKVVTSSMVNQYLHNCNMPTAHKIRHMTANKMFLDLTKDKKFTRNNVEEKYMEIVKTIADKLGHDYKNTIKTYLDAELTTDLFDKYDKDPKDALTRQVIHNSRKARELTKEALNKYGKDIDISRLTPGDVQKILNVYNVDENEEEIDNDE